MVIYKQNPKGQNIGFILNDIFYTDRNPNHFFKKYQGFGLSEVVVRELIKDGAKYIIFNYHGVKGLVRYKCLVSLYNDSKLKHIDKTNGFDDEQVFVRCNDMEILKDEH